MSTQLFERTFHHKNFEFGSLTGNLWIKVFYHSYENGELFSGPEEAKYTKSNDKYSILANITENFKVDNKYEFIIYYPENNVYFRWFQDNNPINENEKSNVMTASGFEARDSNH